MDKNDIINYVMYTPHNTNKAILSDMLNQLTEGGGGGAEPLLVTITGGTLEEPATMDKTWQEICDAFPNIAVYTGHPDGMQFTKTPITKVSKMEQGGYSVVTPDPTDGSMMSFTADSASDYPVLAIN